jgi:GcrA cell cycle regulator
MQAGLSATEPQRASQYPSSDTHSPVSGNAFARQRRYEQESPWPQRDPELIRLWSAGGTVTAIASAMHLSPRQISGRVFKLQKWNRLKRRANPVVHKRGADAMSSSDIAAMLRDQRADRFARTLPPGEPVDPSVPAAPSPTEALVPLDALGNHDPLREFADAAPPPPSGDQAPDQAAAALSELPIGRSRMPACCWPIGAPGTRAFRFCEGIAVPKRPYCAQHTQIAYCGTARKRGMEEAA